MKKDLLKQYIDDNYSEKDFPELPDSFVENFNKRLDQEENDRKVSRFYSKIIYAGIAASLLMLLTFNHIFKNEPMEPDESFMAYNSEVIEMMNYYNMLQSNVIYDVQESYDHNRCEKSAELYREIKKIAEDSRRFEETELPNLPRNDEGLMVARIHYVYTLKTMKMISETLYESN